MKTTIVLSFLTLLAAPAHAQQAGAAKAPHHPATHGGATGDMHETMTKMHAAMNAAKPTGDVDRDFVEMMIPHHQGAIDMSRVYLKTAKDPAIRAMAEKIIKDQEREIAEFRAWLAKKPAPAH